MSSSYLCSPWQGPVNALFSRVSNELVEGGRDRGVADCKESCHDCHEEPVELQTTYLSLGIYGRTARLASMDMTLHVCDSMQCSMQLHTLFIALGRLHTATKSCTPVFTDGQPRHACPHTIAEASRNIIIIVILACVYTYNYAHIILSRSHTCFFSLLAITTRKSPHNVSFTVSVFLATTSHTPTHASRDLLGTIKHSLPFTRFVIDWRGAGVYAYYVTTLTAIFN